MIAHWSDSRLCPSLTVTDHRSGQGVHILLLKDGSCTQAWHVSPPCDEFAPTPCPPVKFVRDLELAMASDPDVGTTLCRSAFDPYLSSSTWAHTYPTFVVFLLVTFVLNDSGTGFLASPIGQAVVDVDPASELMTLDFLCDDLGFARRTQPMPGAHAF